MNPWNNRERTSDILIFLFAILAAFLPVIFIEFRVMKYTGGIFMYPLDDTFIHMKMAENLSFHKTWGINAGQFGSASSSLLYTLILALFFKIFPSAILIPLLINSIAAFLLLLFMHKWLRRNGLNPLNTLFIMLMVIFLTPFPVLIISGMEHMLQCLFSILFIFYFSEWLQQSNKNKEAPGSIPFSVCLFGMLASAIRYEGIFLVGIAGLILLINRKIVQAFLLGFISFLPLLLFGLYSIKQGSYFLPNSVLVKSESIPINPSGLLHFINNVLTEKLTLARAGIAALATQRLLLIIPLVLIAFRQQLKVTSVYFYILVIYFGAVLLHLSLAATGWFYRYEAYMIAGVLLISGFLVFTYGRKIWSSGSYDILMKTAVIILITFLIFPIILRSTAAFSKARQACINIYEQQYQMGQFTRKYYNHNVIAANDIGAISYLSNARILDLWGLASIEVAKSKKGNYWTPDFLDSLVHKNHTDIVMVYDSWFSDSLLQRWTKVAAWKIQKNVVCGDSIVSFYTIEKEKAAQLKANLVDYQKNGLPQTVGVTYYQ